MNRAGRMNERSGSPGNARICRHEVRAAPHWVRDTRVLVESFLRGQDTLMPVGASAASTP